MKLAKDQKLSPAGGAPLGKKLTKISKRVVEAMIKLRNPNGSTYQDIRQYIKKRYRVCGNDIQKHLLQSIRRGVSFGLIESDKRGHYKLNSGFILAAKVAPSSLIYDCRRKRTKSRSRKRRKTKRRKKCSTCKGKKKGKDTRGSKTKEMQKLEN